MKVTVCELHDDRTVFADGWQRLLAHVRAEQSELVLLPEMPFCKWFVGSRNLDARVWEAAVRVHDEWEHRLRELAPAAIAASRPVDFGNERYNKGFLWDADHGSRAVHAKAFLPNEEGGWEASWYNSATPEFTPLLLGSVSVGFLFCTELWATDESRLYGQEGVHLLLTPRTTAAAAFVACEWTRCRDSRRRLWAVFEPSRRVGRVRRTGMDNRSRRRGAGHHESGASRRDDGSRPQDRRHGKDKLSSSRHGTAAGSFLARVSALDLTR